MVCIPHNLGEIVEIDYLVIGRGRDRFITLDGRLRSYSSAGGKVRALTKADHVERGEVRGPSVIPVYIYAHGQTEDSMYGTVWLQHKILSLRAAVKRSASLSTSSPKVLSLR